MLETKRLLMRPLEESDLENIKRTLQDEAAMYAYEGAFSDEEAAEWLKRQMKRQDDYGLGLWAVILKETNTFIGQCGLTYQPWKGNKVLEVGYLFERAYWHHGYATEAARAWMDYAFTEMKAPDVCSIIRDTNLASRNVALRNGMHLVDEDIKVFRGVTMPHVRFVKQNL
jgi:ribosomal-protein-alanine N-acetyltransferase